MQFLLEIEAPTLHSLHTESPYNFIFVFTSSSSFVLRTCVSFHPWCPDGQAGGRAAGKSLTLI